MESRQVQTTLCSNAREAAFPFPAPTLDYPG